MGGSSTPPVEAQASTPAAVSDGIPTFFIAGMVSCPVVSTLVTTLPLMEPIRPLEKMATLAGPPRTCPSSAKARSRKTPAAGELQRDAEQQKPDHQIGKRAERQAEDALDAERVISGGLGQVDGSRTAVPAGIRDQRQDRKRAAMTNSDQPPARRTASSSSTHKTTHRTVASSAHRTPSPHPGSLSLGEEVDTNSHYRSASSSSRIAAVD